MYKIYADGETIHNPALNDDTHLVVDAKISQKVNMADALEFTIYPNNAGAASIHKLTTTIEVYQDELLLFRGRPIQSKTGWENQVTYTCEGGLAVLNDTIVRPYSFTGSVRDYLQQLITQHNNQVPAAKQITLRNVTVTDPNNTIVRSNQDYVTTMQEIQDKLVENLGGYLVLSYDAQTGWILDYLAASPRATGQAITLAKNLLDILREQNAENIATALIPLGAVDEETGERITIRTVNGGQDYIVDQTAAARYGLIFTTETWDDVTLPANLLRKAQERLTDYATMIPTIKLTAVDLSAIDPDLDPIRILDEVTVQDDKHEASGVYLVAERTYDLSAPERDTVTFGGDLPSITKASAKTAAEVQDIPAQILQTASDRTRAILDAATEGAIQILYNENGVAYELRINNSQNPATATKWWRYNSAGWGYTDDGGQTYTIAATMDGAIVASLITTGILKSDDGQTFFLDLDNGILRGNFETLTIEGKTVDQVAGGVLDSFVDGTYAAFVTSTNNGITAALDAASGAASAASSAQAAASSASAAAANAQATADKKITTYYQTLAPTTHNLGDLWIDTDDSNKLYRWNGSSWVNVRDTGIQSALTAAANAQTTADGKIMTYAQASAPSSADLDVGDLWIDTDDKNRLYRWSGSQWTPYTDSSAVDALDQSLDQQEVFDRLTNNQANQGIYLSGTDLYINASMIMAGILSGRAINNGNGTFTVDENGDMTAQSGNIGGWDIGAGGLSAAMTYGGVVTASMASSWIQTLSAILLGTAWPTVQQYINFDVDGTGKLNSADLAILQAVQSRSDPFNQNTNVTINLDPSGGKLELIGEYDGRFTFDSAQFDSTRKTTIMPGGVQTGGIIANDSYISGTEVVNLLKYTSQQQVSDRRLKHDIQPIPDAVREALLKIEPVRYRLNHDSEKIRYGFIAQDVHDSDLKDIVSEDGGFMALNYIDLIAVLCAEVQDLNRRVEALEKGE